ncbi:MAG: hypothetical protein U9Q07_14760 [Planctomycetota bacterium]|nr:hypothetical protein [Planctomycetota bacterium]
MGALDNYDAQLGRVSRNEKTLFEALESQISSSTPPDGSVTTAKLGADAVTGAKIADDAVDTEHIADDAVENAQIADDAVDSDQIAAGAVDNAHIADGTIALAKQNAGVQTSLGLADTALQPGELVGANGTPVNAVAASGVLTISGVVIDGETVTIGSDVYEFCADAAQSLTGGSDFAVDIESDTTKSAATLTVDTQPTAGDDMTIGSKTYTFVPDGTANADGEITVGTDLATAQAAIVAAINGSDGNNNAHTQVSAAAFAVNASVITALVGGTAGDSIASTENFTAGSNIFDAVTLGTTAAGADCTAANAVTALVTSVTANDTEGVGAADGAGDTVDLTADTKGTAANSIATTEAMANGSFGAVTLESGVDGTVGAQWDMKVDSSYLYVCIATNTIADANWRRVSLGTAY